MPSNEKPPLVIYADDNDADRQPKKMFMKLKGMEVADFGDGGPALDEAKKQMEAGRNIVVVSDGDMIQMHGPELLREIQRFAKEKNLPTPPAVMHSGTTTAEDLAGAGVDMASVTMAPKSEVMGSRLAQVVQEVSDRHFGPATGKAEPASAWAR